MAERKTIIGKLSVRFVFKREGINNMLAKSV